MNREFNKIAHLVRQGRRFFKKIANVDLDGAFVYWKPETGCYAVAMRTKEAAAREAVYRHELYKCGCLPFTVFDNTADESSGWVLLRYPESYSPAETFKKHAAATINTPAGLSLAGMLIGGTLGAGKALLYDDPIVDVDEYGFPIMRSWGTALKDAAKSALVWGGLGTTPGLLASLGRYSATRPRYLDGTRGPSDVGYWSSFTDSPDELRSKSEAYRENTAKYKQASVFRPLENSNVINVDAFNRTIWNDTGYGIIDPDNALLLTSTMEASKKGRSPFVTPGAIVGTLINAGIGYATAGIVGKTLGALNMCPPETQAELRNIGIWGGVLNGLGNQLR